MTEYKSVLLSKNGRVILALAREFLACKPGDRIGTVEHYSQKYNIGRGTVQSALKFLQSIGAVHLESRGHLGTYLEGMSHKKLWEVADYGVIMAVMPLPYSKRYEGLATGLFMAFEEADLPFSLAFMRGASKRLEALELGKYNLAVLSKLAARLEIQKGTPIEIIHEFGVQSYVSDHVVIFRDDAREQIEPGMRVAVDPASVDQTILTCYECEGIEVDYVETSYAQILHKLAENQIDAAVWNLDEVVERKLNYQPLRNRKSQEVAREDTTAVLAVHRDEKVLGNVLRRLVNMEGIEAIQRQVISGELIPSY
ncbi:MAG: hypothetical protein FH749_04570 [Firmicutes bacterium]|nr:hypothetical protein [Bacillota bacterium]